MIFIDIATAIASQTDTGWAQIEVHIIESVITYQSTAMCTDPDETVWILENIIRKIIRHSCRHIEIAYIKATRKAALRKTAQGYE